MRIHVGSGLIYLDGYVNLDVRGSGARLATEHPEGVEKWHTTEDRYYGRMDHITQDRLERGFVQDHSDAVCDVYASWSALPFADESADEILSRQVFEHLSMTEARSALTEAYRVLKPGGLLRLSVPDFLSTLEAYRQTGKEFFKRHIVGSLKNDYAYHVMAWTAEALIAFAGEYGFAFDQREPNIHCYPSICLRFKKSVLPLMQGEME